jgi:hypothetical protein
MRPDRNGNRDRDAEGKNKSFITLGILYAFGYSGISGVSTSLFCANLLVLCDVLCC